MNCPEIRERLLPLVYELLDDAEECEVRAHLEACGGCREALAHAREQHALLAEAASLEAPPMRFAAPSRRGRVLALAAAAAAVLLAAVGLLVWRAGARADAAAGNPRVVVRGPAAAPAATPAEYRVRAVTASDAPFTGEVALEVTGPDGRELGRQAPFARDGGDYTFTVPADLGEPGDAMKLRFEVDGDPVATTILHRGPTSLVAYVAPDKPLYRPGEPVRVRGVVLERFRLVPAGNRSVSLEVKDARGTVVQRESLVTEAGVAASGFALPAAANGGIYTATLTDSSGAFPPATREFAVRSYRVPRLTVDTELDRDSYGPGEKGKASVRVERAEGGAPAGAKVRAQLVVDGKPGRRTELALDGTGCTEVPFALPEKIANGRGVLVLTIEDGGNVETETETVPISLDRLDVALYPEGGDLVAGLPARVYFSVRDSKGEPAALAADVVDSAGKRVAAAETVANGMGRFALTPAAGETYRLVPRAPAGVRLTGAEVKTVATGVSLATADARIAAGGDVRVDLAATTAGDYGVSVWCRGVRIGERTVVLAAGATKRVAVPTTADVGGVLRVTVTDPKGVPRAERLVARAPARKVEVAAVPGRAATAPGEEQVVRVTTRDEKGEPVSAVVGVTVVDDAVRKLADDEDAAPMPMHFLLGLDVDELENVTVYSDSEEGARAVDLLLGTQGWRRFSWREPKAFVAAHPDAGARVEPVGTADAGRVLVDTGPVARVRLDRVEADIDSRRLPALGLLALSFLCGAGLLAVVRRGGPRAKLSLASGFVASFGLGLLCLSGPPPGDGGETARETALVARAPVAAETALLYEGRMSTVADYLQREVARLEDVTNGIEPAPGWPLAAPESSSFAGGVEYDVYNFRQIEIPYEVRARFTAGGKARPVTLLALRDIRVDGRIVDVGGAGGGDGTYGYYSYSRVLTRMYAHQAAPNSGPERSDFTEVLYWNPLLVTDADGQADFRFSTSDSITTFRIVAEAFDGSGGLGAGDGTFANRIPFYVEPKLPVALSAGDELELPVVVANAADAALSAGLRLDLGGDLLSLAGDADRTLDLAPGARGRAIYRLRAKDARGEAVIDLSAAAGNLADRVHRIIPIVPRGYPVAEDRAGTLEGKASCSVVLPDEADLSTLAGSLRLYPSVIATLTDGLESLLRTPGGCFEQASSSNYPNVMILTLLSEGSAVPPETVRRAKDLLAKGYPLLTGYECESRGYEWYGRDPGHQALTAYGLMEFADMARVYDVNREMVARTRDWLLAARDGDGGFVRGSTASIGNFGRAPRPVEEAYIVWALTEAGVGGELGREIDALRGRAVKSEDSYLEALAALALLNAGRDAKALVADLVARQRKDGSLPAAETSVTSSRGGNLVVETTALAAMAYLKAGEKAAAERAVRFLVAQRKAGGRFGATQATILSLKALVLYAKEMGRMETDHDLTVYVNGRPVADRHVPAGSEGTVVFEREVTDALVAGRNEIEIRTTGAEALPFGLEVRYRTTKPPSDPACAVAVTTKLAATTVPEGEATEVEVTLVNREEKAVPMTLVRVGLPAGLVPREKQLKEMRDAGEIAFFETRPREVTLYLDGMAGGATRTLHLDLTAEIPGRFEGPATSAYLYYTDDRQSWAAPLRVTIPAAR